MELKKNLKKNKKLLRLTCQTKNLSYEIMTTIWIVNKKKLQGLILNQLNIE
jgi:hypothetical protein